VGVGGLLQQQLFHDIAFFCLLGKIDRVKSTEEKDEENNDQDELKEYDVKMAHHPTGREVVPLPDLIHEIPECHHPAPFLIQHVHFNQNSA